MYATDKIFKFKTVEKLFITKVTLCSLAEEKKGVKTKLSISQPLLTRYTHPVNRNIFREKERVVEFPTTLEEEEKYCYYIILVRNLPLFQEGFMELIRRPRRNRKSIAIRALAQENYLTINNLCSPHFVVAGEGVKTPLDALPGMYRVSVDQLLFEIEEIANLGIQAVALFPIIEPQLKKTDGQEALNPQGLVPRAAQAVKRAFPQLCVITDVALDPFTSHGHDGIPDENGEILNDETVARLAKMAIIHAGAGVDIVAPSDMMDGRVLAIRKVLDEHHFQNTSILAYTAKYASQFYGPYRDTLGSTLKFGDKKGYFMNPANKKEALLEAALDAQEGADILMVKPALIYLDVIAALAEATLLPVAAYHVSGEYAMIQAAAEKGWIDADQAYMECALAMRRAGANLIFTYAARSLAKQLSAPKLVKKAENLMSQLF